MLNVFIAFVTAFAASFVLARAAEVSISKLDPEAYFQSGLIVTWGTVSGFFIGLLFSVNADASGIVLQVSAVSAICAVLGVSSSVDRQMAWAPDVLILPACIFTPMIPDLIAQTGTTWSFMRSGLIGVGIFSVSQVFWFLQVKFDIRFAPPADIIALLLPFSIFGISTWIILFYIMVSVLLVLCMKFEPVRHVFSSSQALVEAGDHMKYKNSNGELSAPDESITFLAVAFPSLLFILAVYSFFTV